MANVLKVPCGAGTLVAVRAGDPGVYDEVEVDLVRRSDGRLVQLACIGTDPDGTLHVYTQYGEAGPGRSFLPDVESLPGYPADALGID